MSSFDPDLLQRLAEADAAAPPAPGGAFTPEGLAHLAARRTQRRPLKLTAAICLLALAMALWPRPTTHGDDGPSSSNDVRALRARLDELQQTLRAWSAQEQRIAEAASLAHAQRDAANTLRLELAVARADALLALTAPSPTRRSHR
ncbi:MAG TPA: hypothetical protein VFZ65_10670 [Planctomycetota bacterium]|nr:hypothetical protein [Planctomycetota bacterium]